ncbi:SacI homology domain-containing protein [Melampsora americana]|nr:SacI homology domain-containing protein [Melampsora americana]
MSNLDEQRFEIYSNLSMYISDQAYTLVPASNSNQPSLVISRPTNEVSLGPVGPPARADRSVNSIAGVLGIISLIKSDYLVLVKSARKVATLFKTAVFTPTAFSVYPISVETNAHLLENSDERYLLSVLKAHLDNAVGKMFFTYNNKPDPQDPPPWDITNSLQRQTSGHKSLETSELPLWKKADDRFFWNRHLQTRLINLASKPEGTPLATINGQKFTFGIVSRRSRHRAGTRYFSRGINLDGEVSNFNESEMIFATTPSSVKPNKAMIKASYVQTRGHDLKIMEIPQTQESLRKHFEKQVEIYGDQYIVNLVNSSGYEKAVKEAYERGVHALGNPRVHYTYFDFHHECKGLRFDRVQLLIDRLQDELVQQGYYYLDESSSPSPLKEQTSVVRSNCMDCLDRTGVVQSALAKWVLTAQLKQAGILNQRDVLDSHPEFMSLFRHLWADNADAVSKAYSGTGALKTDYTRFGVRSKQGALNDGINSVMRYIKNNFLDGPRQDSYDLFTGAWLPLTNTSGSLRKSTSGVTKKTLGEGYNTFQQTVCLTFSWSCLLCIILSLFVFFSATFTENRSYKVSLMSIIVGSGCFAFILANGVAYVNGPKLISRKDIIAYSGPGHESSRKGRGWGLMHESGLGKDEVDEKKRLD